MANDFSNLSESGKSCVGCGRTSAQVRLKKLRTYARSYACADCYVRHWNCGNLNGQGKPCNHPPNEHLKFKGPCQQAGCGCVEWIHGLEQELDRQYAACVGLEPRIKECGGFGQELGKCGRLILIKPDGELSRLCPSCEDRWIRETKQGISDASKLLELDVSKVELPT